MEKFKKFLREYPDSSLAPGIRKMLFEKRTAALSAELQATCPGLVWIRMDFNHVRPNSILLYPRPLAFLRQMNGLVAMPALSCDLCSVCSHRHDC